MTKSERAALREHWRQIVTECENRDASISKRAWCEEHGIVLRLLYYWQRQFREGNDEPQSTPAFLDLTDVWEERHEKPGESSSMKDKAIPVVDDERSFRTEPREYEVKQRSQ